MSRNHTKNNLLQFGSLAPWVVAVIFLGVTGISYVAFKMQMHLTANQIKALEKELFELNTQNEVFRARISSRSSRKELQRHLDSGFISMVPITNERIVRLNDHPTHGAVAEIRPVANKRFAE